MNSPENTNKRKKGLMFAGTVAGLISMSTIVGASVLVQNFMSADYNAGAPPCLIKVDGADTSFDGFAFDATGTTSVDGVNLTQEKVTIDGLTGDRVSAQDVYTIVNKCNVDLEVEIGSAVQTGDWTEKHLEVYLGLIPSPTDYPGNVVGEYDTSPLVFEDGGPTNKTTGKVVVPSGSSVPVGMIVSTGANATGTGSATWTVQAEM